MTQQNRDRSDAKLAAVNDNRPNTVQSGEVQDDELWSRSILIPLVRLLARQAAAELFAVAANDNVQSQLKRSEE